MAIMVLTVADVILRSVFNRPISGSVELCELFIVVGGFLGVAWCCQKGGHVKVDILVSRWSPRWQAIADSVNNILAIFIIPLISWQLIVHGLELKIEGNVTDTLHIPLYPFYIIAGLGFALLSFEILLQLVKSLYKTIAGGNN